MKTLPYRVGLITRGCFLLLVLTIGGCAVFTSGTSTVVAPIVEEKQNGFLVELPSNDSHPQADALVASERWVIVTVVDPLYDLTPFERFSSPYVDSLEVNRFVSAVQISMRFRQRLSEASIVSSPLDPVIQISVFTE